MVPGILTVIVPVLNEAPSIERVIQNLRAIPLRKEIVIVDDGSTDGTPQLLRGLPPAPEMMILRHDRNCGKAAAIRTALGHTRGEFVVIHDADLEYQASDLPALVKPLIEGVANVVYGVRQDDGPARGCWLFLGARLLTALTNLLYRCDIHDEATCYKAFRRSLLERLVLEREGFDFCPEVTAKLCRIGEKIYEVPIAYHPRPRSEGKKLRLYHGVSAVATLMRYRFTPRRRFDRAFSAARRFMEQADLEVRRGS